MIIDQLTPTVSDNLTDEVPVEQGTSTFKTTWQKILNLFKSNINLTASDIASTDGDVQNDIDDLQSDVGTAQTDIGDMVLTTTATDLTGAVNELNSGKQDTLVSGTNIKTVDGLSLVGSGDVDLKAVFDNVNITKLQFRKKFKEISHHTATTVTWDTAFPNGCLAVIPVTDQANFAAASTVAIYYSTITASSFQCYVHNTASAAQKIWFIGIGY